MVGGGEEPALPVASQVTESGQVLVAKLNSIVGCTAQICTSNPSDFSKSVVVSFFNQIGIYVAF